MLRVKGFNMLAVVFALLAAMVGLAHGRTITVGLGGAYDFDTIQVAIDDSNDGDTVLVANGTYTGDGNRDIDFHGKAITVKSENGPETCIIDCNGSEYDEYRGFYFHSGEDCNSAVIGFTITNGYAPGERITMPPFFSYIHLGGGIRCDESSPTISHCRIMGNWADAGGGIYSEDGSPIVTRCTITGNYAQNWGGGIYAKNSSPVLTNCIVWGNVSHEIYVYEDTGPVTASYCDIEGGWPGIGNIDADPCFADPGYWDPNGSPEDANDDYWVNGDYHLKSQGGRWDPSSESWVVDDVTSLCIDAGDPMSRIGPEAFPNGGIINMGAYGGTSQASKSYFGAPPCEVIVAGDVNGDCRVDFYDFAILASHWLERVNLAPVVHIIEPQDGDVVEPGMDSVCITVDAWDGDGSVVKVEFFIDGIKFAEENDEYIDGVAGWTACTSFDSGTYILTAKATDNEGATTTSPPVMIRAGGGPGPDLTVSKSDITFSNPHPVPGEEIIVSVTVHNIGDVDAGEFVVYVAWSGSFDGVNWTIPMPWQEVTIPHLSAGSSTTVSRNGVFWRFNSFMVLVDYENQVQESYKGNNYASRKLQTLP